MKAWRIIFTLSILLITYLLIYRIDLNSTAVFARNILTPFTNLNQIVVEPLIPITNGTTTTATAVPSVKIDKVVQVIPSNSGSINELNNITNKSIDEQPKEAFVTFSNNQPSYLALLKILLDSVHAFSTRPIIAFGIDVDLDIDTQKYPRVIKRRIKQSDCGPVRYIVCLSNKLIKIISSYF
jgi:hypothetical protein